MLASTLKIALRNALRYKGYTLINILGLAVGLACCIVILLYDRQELSFDRHWRNADRIRRISMRAFVNGSDLKLAVSAAPLKDALLREIPGIQAATRVFHGGAPVIRYGEKVFSEERYYFGDSSFFDVFPMRFIAGDPSRALAAPENVVLTASSARKYFGTENPVGKTLNLDHARDVQVSAVVEDVPTATHFHFDFLVPMSNNRASKDPWWLSNNFYTYVVLSPEANLTEFQRNLDAVVDAHIAPQVKAALGVSIEQMRAAGSRYGYVTEPVTSIHLHSQLEHELEANSDISYIYVFSAVAVGILLIACINFTNLATARSERRAREVGIRKTLGSQRWQLIRQFTAESVAMCSVAVALALVIAEFALPSFNAFAGRDVHLSLFDDLWTIPLLLVFTLVVGIAAGAYPALFLSSFRPAAVLKPGAAKGSHRSWLRSALVVFQFAISIILIVGTLVVNEQMRFIQAKRLGFDKEHVVVMSKVDDIAAVLPAFKREVLASPLFVSATNSSAIPGRQFSDNGFYLEGHDGGQMRDVMTVRCDEDFAAAYGIRVQQGRFLSREHPSDSGAVVINASAARAFGLTDPVGKRLVSPTPDRTAAFYPIIGVVDDFHFESLRQEIRPLVLWPFHSGESGRMFSVRLAAGDPQDGLRFLEANWHKFAGSQAFEYSFLDDELMRQYRAERRTGEVVTVFSAIAIVVACLGLLGLVAFVAERRTKEIGIRKVMGATVGGIVTLLTREFVLLVVVANAIALPTAYVLASRWLEQFAYRVDASVWAFALAGVAGVLIAFATVSYQGVRAALADPVKALRYE